MINVGALRLSLTGCDNKDFLPGMSEEYEVMMLISSFKTVMLMALEGS